MSGRCYSCGDPFKKFFSGEKGCKSCGFEFCKKCITKKIAIPKLKNEEHSVCNKCYRALSSGKKVSKPRPQSPPKVHVQRMEALECKGESLKSGPHKSSKSNKIKADKKYAGMDPEDADLAKRLDALKEERSKMVQRPDAEEIEQRLGALKAGKPDPPSEQEMRDRLAELQNKPQSSQQRPQYIPPDKRTNDEQIVDLLDELFDENQIELRQQGTAPETARPHYPTPASKPGSNSDEITTPASKPGSNSDEINLQEINALIEKSAKELKLDAENALLSLQQDEQLMAKLKELKKKPNENVKSMDIHATDNGDSDAEEENEDKVAENLIKRYLEEARLEEATARAIAESNASANTTASDQPAGKIPDIYQPKPEDEEFPWCCICNDDAKIRCLDCDRDLFCAQCFGEGHKEAHMKDHEFERYRKPE